MRVYKHNGLLKASIMNTIPPGLELPMRLLHYCFHLSSVRQPTDAYSISVEKSDKEELSNLKGCRVWRWISLRYHVRLSTTPDRNRTSPFAFTAIAGFDSAACVVLEANCASQPFAPNSADRWELCELQKTWNTLVLKGRIKDQRCYRQPCREDAKTCKTDASRWHRLPLTNAYVKLNEHGLEAESSCPVIFERYRMQPVLADVRMIWRSEIKRNLKPVIGVKWETCGKDHTDWSSAWWATLVSWTILIPVATPSTKSVGTRTWLVCARHIPDERKVNKASCCVI